MSIPEFPDHQLKVRRERRQKERRAAGNDKFLLGLWLVGIGFAWALPVPFGSLAVFGLSWVTAKLAAVFFATGLLPILFGVWLLWKTGGDRRKARQTKRFAREGRLDEMQQDE